MRKCGEGVLGVAILCAFCGFMTNGRTHGGHASRQDIEVPNWWIETHGLFFLKERELLIRGPYVVRCLEQPTFVFPTLEMKSPRVDKQIPFIIVINEKHAFRALSSIETGNPSIFSWKTSGRVMGQDVPVFGFQFEFEWFEWEKGVDGLNEVFEIQFSGSRESEDRSFDLSDGRVFEVSLGNDNSILITQRDIALPASGQIDDFEGFGKAVGQQRAKILVDWWLQHTK